MALSTLHTVGGASTIMLEPEPEPELPRVEEEL